MVSNIFVYYFCIAITTLCLIRYHVVSSTLPYLICLYSFTGPGLEPGIHIPHTWGTGWTATVDKQPQSVQDYVRDHPVKFIIASDILLYVR